MEKSNKFLKKRKAEIDLSQFYQKDTLLTNNTESKGDQVT